MVFGDPHVDNDGCDFPLLESHVKIAAQRRGFLFAGNIGDLHDNWIGRLERLYALQTISKRETWKLVEWLMTTIPWLFLVKGNHDLWSGGNDPIDWIVRGGGTAISQDHGVRIGLQHPNGAVTRVHARHDFPGNSQYNPLHALKRETLRGHRDHLLIAGHRHIGADAGDVHGDGAAFQMVRVCGYKFSDEHAHALGVQAKPIHPAAIIVINPDVSDGARNRVFCTPTVEEGADYLDFLRKRFERGVSNAS